ncbi:hypothetical protein BC940DRAFT_274346 [Gongronella butleri]|nr:hypothetical protein BC940DRAFT_274346 [Gongronella butleri]
MQLTPTQAHYLKKELITLQLQSELDAWKKAPQLQVLFAKDDDTRYPFMRYLFQSLVVSFPLLKQQQPPASTDAQQQQQQQQQQQNSSNDQFWSKCQTFLDQFHALRLETYVPKNKAASQRRILMAKLSKASVLAMTARIRTTQDGNYVAKGPEQPMQGGKEDADIAQAMEHQVTLDDPDLDATQDGLEINVIGVRDSEPEKRSVRSDKVHAEFLVQTTLDDGKTITVARRHGQFRQLRDDLQAAFPASEVPPVPSKASDASYRGSLYREKDRLLLRAFLHQIACIPKLESSAILETFLTSQPVQLTPAEQQAVDQRLAIDKQRLEAAEQFQKQVNAQISQLNDLLVVLKRQVAQPGGLLEIFDVIRTTDKLENLPDYLKKAFEWGRINFAYVLHTQFVTSDRSVENVANLKRTHMLMPYRAIAQILKLSNPFAMVKGVLDLFLSQPFGGRSLFQRILLVNMHDQAKELQRNIEELEKTIADPALCAKIRNATELPRPDDLPARQTIIEETMTLLRNPEITPALTAEQIKKVALIDQDKEARLLVVQLGTLWKLYGRQRDQELIKGLVFQGVTSELIKDLVAIFYQPLAQVYKSANIGDAITDTSAFLDDLIKLLDSLDVRNVTNCAPQFVDLVKRHEQPFYRFVHDVHAQDKSHVFADLLNYIDRVASFIASGQVDPSDASSALALPEIDMATLVDAVLADPKQQQQLLEEIDATYAFYQERKTVHATRRHAKLASAAGSADYDILQVLPGGATPGMAALMDDMADLELMMDSESDTDDEGNDDDDHKRLKARLAHEAEMVPPPVTILPTLVPLFTDQVTTMLAAPTS